MLSSMRGAFDDKHELLEHVEQISTDEHGVPDLHLDDAAGCHHNSSAKDSGSASSSGVTIPSVLERMTCGADRCGLPGDRQGCSEQGVGSGAADSGDLLAATAACSYSGLLALQHPLQWENGTAAAICTGWDKVVAGAATRSLQARSL